MTIFGKNLKMFYESELMFVFTSTYDLADV